MVKEYTSLQDIARVAREKASGMGLPARSEEEWRRTDVTVLDWERRADAGVRVLVEGDGPGAGESPAVLAMLERLSGRLDNVFLARALGSEEVVWVRTGGGERVVRIRQGERVRSDVHVVVEARPGEQGVVRLVHEGGRGSVLNVLVSVWVGEGARVVLVDEGARRADAARVVHVWGEVERGAVLEHASLVTGSWFTKQRVHVRLAGEGAEAFLRGVMVAGRGDHYDARTVQEHVGPQTRSLAQYHAVAGEDGRTVYQGLIEVAGSARGTDAYLSNKNLLLSEEAASYSIPTLSIGTDDVRCSHGSTTGHVREEELFYLRSRGIPEEEAVGLLAAAHIRAVTDHLPSSLAERVARRAERKVKRMKGVALRGEVA
ncbi:SufBD protein [Spirochaeta thermophila DSM 6578]|uniref:SufBD protein n=1 Tax=Winmispira thermophila (strain ATCC 700085 / DSM 6578 / Z-1203) TaxID=869211 RepID=G0G9X2_WINT7|nr:SufD family Fe-S cluster assembly protein [Spirochaeta thermophila]AEJ60872.1 SufBD protein [Spirochaeta thermophila DSM 6578]